MSKPETIEERTYRLFMAAGNTAADKNGKTDSWNAMKMSFEECLSTAVFTCICDVVELAVAEEKKISDANFKSMVNQLDASTKRMIKSSEEYIAILLRDTEIASKEAYQRGYEAGLAAINPSLVH